MRILLSLALFSLAACGGPEGTDDTGSGGDDTGSASDVVAWCDIGADDVCVNLLNAMYQSDFETELCGDAGGDYRTSGECDRANLYGACTLGSFEYLYYDNGVIEQLEEAEMWCTEMSGSWVDA